MGKKDEIGVFEKFLRFLEKLEPLFRLIEVVFVICGTAFVSIKANSIAEMQLNISKADIQPQFEIREVQTSNMDGIENANTVLKVEKRAGNCNNIEITCICFMEYTYFDELIPMNIKINLPGYYWWYVWKEESDGKICTVEGENNWLNYWKFSKEILETDILKDDYVSLKKYIKISYEDELREKHTNYYYSDGIKGNLLEEKEGVEIFEEYYKNDKQIEIQELNVDNFIKVIEM